MEFNNSFFDFCAREVQLIYDENVEGPIEEVYRGFAQNISGKGAENPGCVDIEFVPQSDELFEDPVLSLLIENSPINPNWATCSLLCFYCKNELTPVAFNGNILPLLIYPP